MLSTGFVSFIHVVQSCYILRDRCEVINCVQRRDQTWYFSRPPLLLYLLMRALWRPAQFVLFLIWTRLDFISFVCFWCLRNQHREAVIIQESNGLPLSEQQQIGFSVTQTSWKHEEKDKTKEYFWGSCLSTFSQRSVGAIL